MGLPKAVDITPKVCYVDGTNSIIDQYIKFSQIHTEQLKKYKGNTEEALRKTLEICKDNDILEKYLELKKGELRNMK